MEIDDWCVQSCDYHVIIMMIVMMIRLSTHSVVSSVTGSHVIGTWFTYSTLGELVAEELTLTLYAYCIVRNLE